jgi:hypothetical protein
VKRRSTSAIKGGVSDGEHELTPRNRLLPHRFLLPPYSAQLTPLIFEHSDLKCHALGGICLHAKALQHAFGKSSRSVTKAPCVLAGVKDEIIGRCAE